MKYSLLILLTVVGLVAPKVSALALHLNPNVMAIVICSGDALVTVHIGADGEPVETVETGHAPCVLTPPLAAASVPDLRWSVTPRSYRPTFVEIVPSARSDGELGLLPDLRGPPRVS